MKLQSMKLDPIERAERCGYRAGLANVQTCKQNYSDSDRLLAWYAGWRRGQREYWQPYADYLGMTIDEVRRLAPEVLAIKLASPSVAAEARRGRRRAA